MSSAIVSRAGVGAWEERDDTCAVESTQPCDRRFSGTSDAICECSPDPLSEQADNVPAPDPEAEVCQCGRMADDLAQLMQVVNQRGVTEAQLAAVLVSPATAKGRAVTIATRSSDCRSLLRTERDGLRAVEHRHRGFHEH